MSREKMREKELLRGLDPGIRPFVKILREHGVCTYESCEGGNGHAYPEPAVRFSGTPGEGWRALCIALDHDLPVDDLRRFWSIEDGEPVGPEWEIVFYRRATDGRTICPAC